MHPVQRALLICGFSICRFKHPRMPRPSLRISQAWLVCASGREAFWGEAACGRLRSPRNNRKSPKQTGSGFQLQPGGLLRTAGSSQERPPGKLLQPPNSSSPWISVCTGSTPQIPRAYWLFLVTMGSPCDGQILLKCHQLANVGLLPRLMDFPGDTKSFVPNSELLCLPKSMGNLLHGSFPEQVWPWHKDGKRASVFKKHSSDMVSFSTFVAC